MSATQGAEATVRVPSTSGWPFAREALLWVATRLFAVLLLLRPDAGSIPSDLKLFVQWSRILAEGRIPGDEMWQYPPGVALLLGLIGVLGLGAAGVFVANLAADFVILAALRGTQGAILWAIAPLFLGPIMLMRLDTISTAFAVLGLGLGISAWRSGIWLGLGAMMKVWPGLLVGAFPWSGTPKRVAALVLTSAAVVATATLAFGADPFLVNQSSRGLQVESVAAWPFLAMRDAGASIDLAFRSGAAEVAHPRADSLAAVLPFVSLALVALISLRTWRSRTPAPDISALLLVLVLLATSRVLSPQFGVWMVGMLSVVVARRPTPRLLVGAVLGSALAGQIVYPYLFDELLLEADGGALAAQGVRLLLLVIAGVLAARVWWVETSGGSTDSPVR